MGCGDTLCVTIAFSGIHQAKRLGTRHRAPMTTGVGLITQDFGVLAADSLAVDFPFQTARLTNKVIKVGERLGMVAGLAAIDGFVFVDALADTLAATSTHEEVLSHFFESAGAHLAQAHEALGPLVGPDLSLVELLVISNVEDTMGLFRGWSELHNGAATMNGVAYTALSHRAVCVAVGVREPIVGYCEESRFNTAVRHIEVPTPSDRLTAEAVARGLVDATLTVESSLPRPAAWPAHVPLAQGPVRSLSI